MRGIATGDALRRLTARTLARTHAAVFDTATRPSQFALHACAGTDALAAVLSAALDTDPSITVVSVDGRSAYDTISRAAVFNKLLEVAPALVPFMPPSAPGRRPRARRRAGSGPFCAWPT